VAKSPYPTYVIYTWPNRTTKRGFVVEHRGLYNLLNVKFKFCCKTRGPILLPSLSFWCLYSRSLVALGVGNTLYSARRGTFRSGIDFPICGSNATHATLPPAVLMIFVEPSEIACPRISLERLVHRRNCSCWAIARRFFNAYGLTRKQTVWATVAEMTDSVSSSIGRAIANTFQIYVLDAHLQPIGIPWWVIHWWSRFQHEATPNCPIWRGEEWFILNPFEKKVKSQEPVSVGGFLRVSG